jgi:hypothetical protein
VWQSRSASPGLGDKQQDDNCNERRTRPHSHAMPCPVEYPGRLLEVVQTEPVLCETLVLAAGISADVLRTQRDPVS